jgi:ferredoxin-like protein FixX
VVAKALAYIARFATKTSPNSVFCATALARATGDHATVEGCPRIARWDLILNVAESRKVASVLAADPAAEAAFVPRPNPTLSDEAGAFLYWRFATVRNVNDDEALSRVRDHPVLRAVLEESQARVTLPELRRRVAARCGLDETDLGPFLRQIVDSGVVVSEIEIPYNERRPLRFVATRAREAGCEAGWIAPALAIEEDVDRLSTLGEAERNRTMARIEAGLAELPHTRPIKADELYRLDAASGIASLYREDPETQVSVTNALKLVQATVGSKRAYQLLAQQDGAFDIELEFQIQVARKDGESGFALPAQHGLVNKVTLTLADLDVSYRTSSIHADLNRVRNVKPLWSRLGTIVGVALGGFDMWTNQLFGLSLFGTLRPKGPDYAQLLPAAKVKPISYEKPDGVITFDLLSSVFLSGTRHDEDEPIHLKLKDSALPIRNNLAVYAEPAQRYCPAGVFEVVASGTNEPRFVINAANCVHCKTCDIKDPAQNITWVPPEGGDGPAYGSM